LSGRGKKNYLKTILKETQSSRERKKKGTRDQTSSGRESEKPKTGKRVARKKKEKKNTERGHAPDLVSIRGGRLHTGEVNLSRKKQFLLGGRRRKGGKRNEGK